MPKNKMGYPCDNISFNEFAVRWIEAGKSMEGLRRVLHHSDLNMIQAYLRFLGEAFVEEEYNKWIPAESVEALLYGSINQ